MNQVFVIARLTFREAVRRKIVLAALVLGICFLLLYSLGFYFVNQGFREEVSPPPDYVKTEAYNFMALAGMYVINFLSIAIAALITADSLAGEIQSGTIQATLSKPIRRSAVVIGKWLGQAFLLLLYLLMMGGGVFLSVLLISRYTVHNWLSGLALIYFNSLIIMTLTLAFSSIFSTLATGGAVFGAFGLSFIGGWVERVGTILRNETAVNLGIVSSLLLPSEALWNKAASIMTSPLTRLAGLTPFSAASEPSPLMLVYAGLYLLAALYFAIRRFANRDV